MGARLGGTRVRAVLADSPHFGGLPGDTLDHIAVASRLQKLRDKQLAASRDGEPGFSIVISGAIQVSIVSASGNASTIAVLGRGSYLGLNALFGSPLGRVKECRSIGTTELGVIAPAALKELVEQDDHFRKHAANLVMSRLSASMCLLADFTNKSISQRIARRLLAQVLAAGSATEREAAEIRTSQHLVAHRGTASLHPRTPCVGTTFPRVFSARIFLAALRASASERSG